MCLDQCMEHGSYLVSVNCNYYLDQHDNPVFPTEYIGQ